MDSNFKEAIGFLSDYLQSVLNKVSNNESCKIEEIRLRAFKPVILNFKDKSSFINKHGELIFEINNVNRNILVSSKNDLEISIKKMCNYSVYSYQKEINSGFITLKGGHRVGICGTAVYEDDKDLSICNIKDISSMNIRINQKIDSLDEDILNVVKSDFKGIILVGSPGSGKTTILRNIAKILSGKFSFNKKNVLQKVALVDERNEFSGNYMGISQNNLGYSDILVNYNKKDAIYQSIRSLSPDIIICDELGSLEDIEAIKFGVSSGVKFILSIHAGSAEEFYKRSIAKEILKLNSFDKIIILSNTLPGKVKKIISI